MPGWLSECVQFVVRFTDQGGLPMKLRVEWLIVLFLSLPLALTAQDSRGRTTNPALAQTQVFNVAVQVNGPNGCRWSQCSYGSSG